VADVRRVRTGQILIQSDAGDARVTIKRGGETVVRSTDKRSLTLAPGSYTLELEDPAPGLHLSPERVEVPRNGRSVVRIERVPEPAPPPTQATPAAAEPARKPEPRVAAEPPEPVGVVRTFRHGEGKVEAVSVSLDGRRAVTGGTDNAVRVWGLPEGRDLGLLTHGGAVFAVAVTPDGKRAASASADKTVRLWDLDSLRELGRFEGHEKAVNALAFSPDGTKLLTGGNDRTVRVWDAATFRPLRTFRQDDRVDAVALTRDGRFALAAGGGSPVRVWDTAAASDDARAGELPGAAGAVLCLAVSPDGLRALAGSRDGVITVWDLPSRTLLRRLEGGPHDWVRSAAFLPDSARVLTGYQGGTLLLWGVEAGRVVHAFDKVPAGRLGLATLPDGTHALSADDDGRVRFWHLP
jgi:WD40 repeat protein